ncbi:MAG: 50S ribosomal protein L32 [Desulfobacterales bacterium]|jgi:large subunit ribosomal protein L32|nr:50S ribosomal protein L32 [Desulfobacterales bacterium]MCD4778634.1 50S ribosomal protein L32 [Desulfobacterales bacterium]
MPVPKRKKSKSKRGQRRSHIKAAAPNLTSCPQCGETKLSHHVCHSCGTYKGRTVIEIEKD